MLVFNKICFFSSLLRHLAAFHSDVKRYLLRATQDKQVELVNLFLFFFCKQTLSRWKLFKKPDIVTATMPILSSSTRTVRPIWNADTAQNLKRKIKIKVNSLLLPNKESL